MVSLGSGSGGGNTERETMTHDQNQLNSLLEALDEKEDRLKEYRGQLDRDYPGWKAKFDLDPENIPQHDARRQYFMNLSVILQNVRLSFIFMRDQLLDPTWWYRIEGSYSSSQLVDTLNGYMTMARQYSLKEIASISEQTLTCIAFSGHGPFALSSSSGLSNASEYVISRTPVSKDCKILFSVLSLLRNTIHSNGTFFPEKGGNVCMDYNGIKFIFEVGKPVVFGNDTMVLMFDWISKAMWEIVTSPEVSSIPYIPVYQPRSKRL